MKNPYFASNKPLSPTLPGKLILPPGVEYDLEIRIKFNTENGKTELQVHSTALKPVQTLQLVGILAEHSVGLLRGVISGELKVVPVTEGENNGNKS